MKRYLALLISVSVCLTQLVWGKDVIVETCPGGQNQAQYKELEGKWIDSKIPPDTAKSSAPGLSAQGSCGSRKVLLRGQNASARFSANLDAAGHYYVYVTWPRASNAKDVIYVVSHAGGQTTKTLTQDGWGMTGVNNSNRWVSLGDYDFKAGEDQYVEMDVTPETVATDTAQSGQAYADAVAFTSAAMTNTGGDTGAKAAVPQATPAVTDLVIEARKEGKNNDKYKEISGTWTNSGDAQGHGKSRAPGLSDATAVGTRKVLCGADAKPEKRSEVSVARFTPDFPTPGHYYVYVTWPREANASTVTYNVKSASGEDKKIFAQDGWGAGGTSNGDMWIELGDYDFKPGQDQYVEVVAEGDKLNALDKRNRCQVYSDAVRFTTQKIEDKGSPSIGNMKATTAPSMAAPSETAAPARTMIPAGTPPPLIPTESTGAAGGPIQWAPDIQSAQDLAKTTNKKILIFFYTPESSTSSYFEKTIFEDPAVKSLINSQYVAVRVNFAENNNIAYALQVFKSGTVMTYDSTGRHLKKIDERVTPQQFVAELNK